MFTGIISAVGRVVSVAEEGDVRRVTIAAPKDDLPAIGASICCAGICLTVTAAYEIDDAYHFTVDLGPETLRLTTAGSWKAGTRINLERSLKVGDELGGHWVAGHVDGMATIVSREDVGETIIFRFEAPKDLARFVAAKGSVALDGTSLTVNAVDGTIFDCHLIPHTLAVTTWTDRRAGDAVNLEVDLVARYVARLLGQS
jgi:riboflavin synthase